ncbi:MAG: FliA/WhiG family RNA polymerase sigma factor [Clostridiales bacterium]|nr:FliA/WhiG family RNA polymerase sigma factor [Clostridiales bacterium]
MNQERAYAEKTNDELLLEFLKNRDICAKQELVLRYSYIVKTIAMQMRGVYISFAEMDDIVNEGIIALMGALEKFDPSRNVKFVSYASLRVRGAVIDFARKQDWAPRSVRKTAKEIDSAAGELYIELGRSPTEHEVAAKMGLEIDKYRKALGDTSLYNLLSLDALLDESQGGAGDVADGNAGDGPDQKLQKAELYAVLKDAITELNPKEQLVISLYYRKELNMKEIAKVLEVSEPRISQIQSNAIRRLRKALEKYLEK